MAIRTIPLPFMTLFADSTTNVFIPVTGWMSSAQISKMRAFWELIDVTGNSQCAPAYQVADHEDSPGTATALVTQTSTPGIQYPSGWTTVGVTIDTKQMFRLGFLVSLSSGSTLALGLAGGRIEMFQG